MAVLPAFHCTSYEQGYLKVSLFCIEKGILRNSYRYANIPHSAQFTKKSLELKPSKNGDFPRKNDRERCKQFTQALQKLKNLYTFSTGNGAKSGNYMACPKMLCRICRGVARQFSGKPKHRANQKNVNLLKHSKTPAPSTFAISEHFCNFGESPRSS